MNSNLRQILTAAALVTTGLAAFGCGPDQPPASRQASLAAIQSDRPADLTPSGETRGLLQQVEGQPKVWLFELPATLMQNGRGLPWNTRETALELHPGETLRVANMQTSTQHTLHSGGNPCPHGGNRRVSPTGGTFGSASAIPVGGWLDCVIPEQQGLGEIPTRGNGVSGSPIYDHFTDAPIFVRVTAAESSRVSMSRAP